MRIINKTGVTSVEGFIVETACSKLFVKYKPAAEAAADKLAEFKAVKFEAQVQTQNNGTLPLVYPTKLADLMEIAASNEGFVRCNADGSFSGTIELSNEGSLDLGKDQLSLSFTNLVAGGVLEVYTLDAPVLTSSFIQYEPVNFQADAPKEIDVTPYYQIALPKAQISKLELKYANGRNISFVAAELAVICDETNEHAMLMDAGKGDGSGYLISGSVDWYCIGIGQAVTAKVTLSAQANCYLVRNAVLSIK